MALGNVERSNIFITFLFNSFAYGCNIFITAFFAVVLDCNLQSWYNWQIDIDSLGINNSFYFTAIFHITVVPYIRSSFIVKEI